MSRFHAALQLVLDELDARRSAGQDDWRAAAPALARLRSARPSGKMGAPTAASASDSSLASDASSEPAFPMSKSDDPALPLFNEESSPDMAAGKSKKPATPTPRDYQPVTDPSLPKAERLSRLRACPERLPCAKCPYGAGPHRHIVFGVGNPDADLMFVGEAPGADEDAKGEPFVGRAGQLLNKIIATMGFQREDIYLANVLKCRPDTPGQTSGNRPPTLAEMESCRPCLFEQIDIIQPKAIVALGATAMRGLLDSVESMGKSRGRWHDFKGIPVMPTYHPSYLLRNQSTDEKRKVWEDMLLVKERLGQKITERDRSYFLTKG